MSKITPMFTKITFYVITFYLFTSIKKYMQVVDLGVRRCRLHDSTNQMLRDAQIIGHASYLYIYIYIYIYIYKYIYIYIYIMYIRINAVYVNQCLEDGYVVVIN